MKFSGVSVRTGKRTRAYFSTGKGSGGGGIWGLLIVAAVIYGITKTILSSTLATVIACIVIAGLIAWFIYRRVKKKKDAEAEAANVVHDYSFVLAGNDTTEKQQWLHDEKIETWVHGAQGTLSLSEHEEGGFAVTFGDATLGEVGSADAAWISEHFDDIAAIKRFNIFGGGTDKNGNRRQFVVEVTAELRPGVEAPKLSTVYLPEPKHNGYFAKSDQVVYVAHTGKIHLGSCSYVNDSCTPMLYEEALDAGYTPCGNCFR